MYHFNKTVIFLSILLSICAIGNAQTSRDIRNSPDFKQAEKFVWDSLAQKVYHISVHPEWFTDSSGMGYTVHTREGNRSYSFDFEKKKRKRAFDRVRMAKSLKDLTGKDVKAQDLQLRIRSWKNRNQFKFLYRGNNYSINLKDYKIKRISGRETRRIGDTILSPQRDRALFIKDYNLYLKELKTGKVIQLTTDGNEKYMIGSAYGWGQTMQGENAVPKPRLQVKWSPDGRKIFTQISDFRNAEKMYLLNWAIDSLYRPQLLSYYRPSPGDSTFVKLIPIIIDLKKGKRVEVALGKTPQILDLGIHLQWTKNAKKLVGTFDHRGFKQRDFISVNPENGKVNVLYTIKSNTNVDYNFRYNYLDDLDEALFTSEETGWKQLYLLNYKDGEVRPVTRGKFVVNQIERVDTRNKVAYFSASGREEDVNPYAQLFYRVNLDGSELKLLTPEPLFHEVEISPDFKYFVDNYSDAQYPTKSVLRRLKDGKILAKIEEADIEDLSVMGWKPPQYFNLKGHDGKTSIYGALWKPTHFNPNKKYPIVDFTYTGPHMNVFPSTFSKGLYGLYDSPQALAELGFVVMEVDGLGSAGRSKYFRDFSYGHLGNDLEDHTLAIRFLGKQYKWVDTTRVGIYGHSFGGYDAAHALIKFNDIYDVAIAESGDHDWRMEKAWYPELYAGWPVTDKVYDGQSNITLASQLQGELLLIHGGIDENVNPSATFKLSEALIKAGKYFDLLIIPSAHHAYPKSYFPYVQRKRWKFFVTHLK